MQILISGKQIDIGEALRIQVEGKIQDLCEKYDLSPHDGTVTFSKDGPMTRCDVEMHLGKGIHVRTHGETSDIHLSFDQASEIFEKRIRRHKKRLVAHKHKRDVSYIKSPALQSIINPQSDTETEEDNPLIIAEVKTEIPTLTVSEAVMHLDLSAASVLLFNNIKHNQLNVVYLRPDGNIGWIAPSQNSH